MAVPPVVALSVPPASPGFAPQVEEAFDRAGYRVGRFPADGVGGRQLEAGVAAGAFVGVLDLVTAELAAHQLGGVADAGPDRLTGGAMAGVPQVLSIGGLESVTLAAGTRPTTPRELDRLGHWLAQVACAARGPTALFVPRDADATLRQSLCNWVYGVPLIEADADFLSEAFWLAAAEWLLAHLPPR